MNKIIDYDEEARKEILDFRKNRRELKKNPSPVETDPEKIVIKNKVDAFMKDTCPSLDKYKENIEKAADSAWFALSEIERFGKHVENCHDSDPSKCNRECPEYIPMEDGKEFMKTILKEMTEELLKGN